MASQFGAKTLDWLKQRGWTEVPLEAGMKGDPRVRSRFYGVTVSLHEAVDMQHKLTGEHPDFLETQEQ